MFRVKYLEGLLAIGAVVGVVVKFESRRMEVGAVEMLFSRLELVSKR